MECRAYSLRVLHVHVHIIAGVLDITVIDVGMHVSTDSFHTAEGFVVVCRIII